MTAGRVFAIVGLGLAMVGAIGAIVVRLVTQAPFLPVTFGFGPTAMIAFITMSVSWASIGAFLVIRRPDNAVGWVMVVAGTGYALSMLFLALTLAFAAEGTVEGLRSAGVAGWITVLCTNIAAVVFLIGFIFPTGRAQSRGWVWILRLSWPFLIVLGAVLTFQPGPLHLFPTLQSPFSFGPDFRGGQLASPAVALFSALLAPALTFSMATRYRSAGRIERQQLKWFALALSVATFGVGFSAMGAVLTNRASDEVGLTVYGFALAGVPVAIAIAILRHHLYDIDRIVSNAIGYGLVSVVLVGAFVVVNLALQGGFLSAITGSNPWAVAASTLLVAVSFNPLRSRVQSIVDRRFHRARYDTERTVAGLAGRLRDEVDMAHLRQDILEVVDASVHPTDVHLWLRPGPTR